MHLAKTSTPRVSIPYGSDFPDNTRRHRSLLMARNVAKSRHDSYVALSKRHCVLPPTERTQCAIIWDQLEEIQSSIDHIDNELEQYWECWDDVECKIYDV